MVKSTRKEEGIDAKEYTESLLHTQSIVRSLKMQQSQLAPFQAAELDAQVRAVVIFMSQADAYRIQNYHRSVVLLANILAIHKDLLSLIQASNTFLSSLSKFFIVISKLQGSQHQPEKIQSVLYGCLYLILLLVYKAGNDQRTKARLLQQIFTHEFVSNFNSLQLVKPSEKMKRAVAMVLTYMVRNKNQSAYIAKFKNMALSLLPETQDRSTKAYLAVVIRKISQELSVADIQKHELLSFVFSCMESEDAETVKNSLTIVSCLLAKFPHLAEKMLRMNLLKHWDVNMKKHPQVCMEIFKLCLPSIAEEKRQNWFRIYLEHVVAKPLQVTTFHLQIIESIIPYLSVDSILKMFENNFMNSFSETCNRKSQQLVQSVMGIQSAFDSRLEKINRNLFIVYKSMQDEAEILLN